MKLPKDELRISITSKCNMKCVYCHNEGNIIVCDMDYDDVERIVYSALPLGIKSVRITGGEPTVHKDIFRICNMLKNKYNLQVGINTNAINKDIIIKLLDNNLLDRIVVGLDYFDGVISKNSPVGISSELIKQNILEFKKSGVNVSVSKVYNNDYENTLKMIQWCIENGIRIKIIEENNTKKGNDSTPEYIEMKNKVVQNTIMDYRYDSFNELQGYIGNENLISFFPSLCRTNNCKLCKQIHLRVTSDCVARTCVFNSSGENLKTGNITKKLVKCINQGEQL